MEECFDADKVAIRGSPTVGQSQNSKFNIFIGK